MAKGSGGTRSTSWRDKQGSTTSTTKTTTAKIQPGEEKLLDAVQSGRYQRMDYDRQSELYDDAARESKVINIKPAEERYNAEQLKSLAYYHSSLFDDINDSLRKGGDGGPHAKVLDSMFDYTLKKDTIVFRGTEKPPTRGADKAYQSTSLSAAKAEYFTNGSKHLHAYKVQPNRHHIAR